MKIAGEKFCEFGQGSVVLKRGDREIPLLLTALPLGWYDRIQATGAVTIPAPPKEFAMDKNGRVLRGVDGKAIETINAQDVNYIRAVNKASERLNALIVVSLLRSDTTVEFEAKWPETETAVSLQAFADAVIQELSAAGITDAEVSSIMAEGGKAADGIKMGEAVSTFLSQQTSVKDAVS